MVESYDHIHYFIELLLVLFHCFDLKCQSIYGFAHFIDLRLVVLLLDLDLGSNAGSCYVIITQFEWKLQRCFFSTFKFFRGIDGVLSGTIDW